MAKIRLDKYLAEMGCGTRSEVKAMIRKGRVTVDKKTVKAPETKIDTDAERVELDGSPVAYEEMAYYLLNKPAGVVSATRDGRQKTVLDLLPGKRRQDLFPVGRLDKDTTGFVLLTDDGAFAHDILSPKKHIPKTYHALVDGPITEQMERDFAQGIRIGPDQTLPASLKKLSSCERGDWGEVILREGLYHQIKRMFGVYGLKVLELKRVKMGRLPLDSDLKEGECRELTPEELRLVASREEE